MNYSHKVNRVGFSVKLWNFKQEKFLKSKFLIYISL